MKGYEERRCGSSSPYRSPTRGDKLNAPLMKHCRHPRLFVVAVKEDLVCIHTPHTDTNEVTS
eukprot:m.361879 g.361879  ORF g.361879 m.361879 type:complete len:62 (-) comp19954_c0_seq1:31-216(-)